jgi:phosphatidylglycerophosphatase A
MSAPGTWGSGAGLLLYSVVLARFNNASHWMVFAGILATLALVAIVLCTIAEKHLGKKDPGEIILDEFVAIPIVYIGAETSTFRAAGTQWIWLWVFVGFALFRLFDITKPFGIRRLQYLPGGIGIVVDDLAAATAACALLHILHFLWALVF